MSLFDIFDNLGEKVFPKLPLKPNLPFIPKLSIKPKLIGGLAADAIDSFAKNVFCDIVKPRVGSILKVDHIGSSLLTEDVCHTGIYIGHDEIVELTPDDDGDAIIRTVSPKEFRDSSLCRTGAFIYIACGKDDDGDCYALCGKKIANRAKQAVGKKWLGKYSLLDNNCHKFCQYCITGDKTGNSPYLGGIEYALEKALSVDDVLWRSTGNGGNDLSFA